MRRDHVPVLVVLDPRAQHDVMILVDERQREIVFMMLILTMLIQQRNGGGEDRIRVCVIGRLEVLVAIVLGEIEAAPPIKLQRPDAEPPLLRWLGVIP